MGRQFGNYLKTTKHTLTTKSSNCMTLLGVYSKKLKVYVYTKTFTQMFNAALLITIKTWKQPRCSSVSEWINTDNGTSRQPNTIHHWKEISYQAMKRYGISERSQSEKAVYHMSITLWHSRKSKVMKTGMMGCGQRWIDRAPKSFKVMKQFCIT